MTLKVKFNDFHQITRARSFAEPVTDRALFLEAGRALLLALCPVEKPIRLLGLTLSALVRRFPRLRLAVPHDQIEYRHGSAVFGITRLPVEWS